MSVPAHTNSDIYEQFGGQARICHPMAGSDTYLCVMPRDDSSKTFSLLCHAGCVSAALCIRAGKGNGSSSRPASGSLSAFLFPIPAMLREGSASNIGPAQEYRESRRQYRLDHRAFGLLDRSEDGVPVLLLHKYCLAQGFSFIKRQSFGFGTLLGACRKLGGFDGPPLLPCRPSRDLQAFRLRL